MCAQLFAFRQPTRRGIRAALVEARRNAAKGGQAAGSDAATAAASAASSSSSSSSGAISGNVGISEAAEPPHRPAQSYNRAVKEVILHRNETPHQRKERCARESVSPSPE